LKTLLKGNLKPNLTATELKKVVADSVRKYLEQAPAVLSSDIQTALYDLMESGDLTLPSNRYAFTHGSRGHTWKHTYQYAQVCGNPYLADINRTTVRKALGVQIAIVEPTKKLSLELYQDAKILFSGYGGKQTVFYRNEAALQEFVLKRIRLQAVVVKAKIE
jgi:hypothetical protein